MTELEERLWLMDLLKKRTGFLVKLDGQLVNALLEWRDNSANAEVARLSRMVKLFVDGWTVHKESLYDEEGVEGWRWEGPKYETHIEIGAWDELPPLPDALAKGE